MTRAKQRHRKRRITDRQLRECFFRTSLAMGLRWPVNDFWIEWRGDPREFDGVTFVTPEQIITPADR